MGCALENLAKQQCRAASMAHILNNSRAQQLCAADAYGAFGFKDLSRDVEDLTSSLSQLDPFIQSATERKSQNKPTPLLVFDEKGNLKSGGEAKDPIPQKEIDQAMLIDFFQSSGTMSTSPFDALKSLQPLLSNIENTPGFVKKKDGLIKFSEFKKDVDDLVSASAKYEKSNFSDADPNRAIVLSKMKKLFQGPTSFVTRVGNIYDAQVDHYQESIQAQVGEKADPKKMKALEFITAQQYLEYSAQASSSTSLLKMIEDTETQGKMQAAGTAGFERFFEPYLKPAFQYLNGQDGDGKKLSTSETNMAGSTADLKGIFCLKLLALPDLTKDIKKECGNASLSIQGKKYAFNDYLEKPQAERACVYYKLNVRTLISKQGGSSAPSSSNESKK
jgi:hypothetical protein